MRRAILLALSAIALAAATAAVFWFAMAVIPPWLALRDAAEVHSQHPNVHYTGGELLSALQDARSAVIQMTLGAGLLASGVVAGYRLLLDRRSSQREFEKARQESATSAQDRFAGGLQTLISDTESVRVAGIIALGRQMREADADHQAWASDIAAVLSTRAVEVSHEHGASRSDIPPREFSHCLAAFEGLTQTALWLDLRSADLSGWRLSLPSGVEVDLRGSRLAGAHIDGIGTSVRVVEGDIKGDTIVGSNIELSVEGGSQPS